MNYFALPSQVYKSTKIEQYFPQLYLVLRVFGIVKFMCKIYIYTNMTSADSSGLAVCGRSLAETGGSNPAEGMKVCLLWVLCFVR
jgi:hypothetical protein